MTSKKEDIKKELEDSIKNGYGPKVARFALSFISGLVPFGGGAIGGLASAWSEKESDDFKKVLAAWLKLQEEEIIEIGRTLYEILIRLDLNDANINERIQSPEYLGLVKKSFKDWSATESEDKRVLIRNLLVNSATSTLTTDDVVRLFIEWIEKYSETHFKIIKEIYANSNTGISRYHIWMNLQGIIVREDSPEADLFKLIIHDLSMGHVIRQFRPTDYYGNFLKQSTRQSNDSNILSSAFENTKLYILTELGKQFVHYTMNEIVPKLTEGKKNNN